MREAELDARWEAQEREMRELRSEHERLQAREAQLRAELGEDAPAGDAN